MVVTETQTLKSSSSTQGVMCCDYGRKRKHKKVITFKGGEPHKSKDLEMTFSQRSRKMKPTLLYLWRYQPGWSSDLPGMLMEEVLGTEEGSQTGLQASQAAWLAVESTSHHFREGWNLKTVLCMLDGSQGFDRLFCEDLRWQSARNRESKDGKWRLVTL